MAQASKEPTSASTCDQTPTILKYGDGKADGTKSYGGIRQTICFELPPVFWISLNFNAHQTKGVYVSYDTSTKGKYSRVGLPGDEEEPKETEFHGDWMVQVLLSRPER